MNRAANPPVSYSGRRPAPAPGSTTNHHNKSKHDFEQRSPTPWASGTHSGSGSRQAQSQYTIAVLAVEARPCVDLARRWMLRRERGTFSRSSLIPTPPSPYNYSNTLLAELAPAAHEHLELVEAERSRSICVDLREESLHATPAALEAQGVHVVLELTQLDGPRL